ncbi:MAG: flagellar hook-basal body complex protein FliE [Rhizobiaceae bacterium]
MIPGVAGIGINLLGNVAEQLSGKTGTTTAGASVGASFGSMISEAANRTMNNLHNSEQVSIQALRGEADTRQVVDAVMSAEQSLQAAIAIRDKIVTAYLEVSRMAI